MEDLENQLYKLVLLPGPEIKHQTINKVKTLARQVHRANRQFSATKILDRAAIFNIFSRSMRESFNCCPFDKTSVYFWDVEMYKDDPPDVLTPFTPYVHSSGQSFESAARFSEVGLDHLDLVRGFDLSPQEGLDGIKGYRK